MSALPWTEAVEGILLGTLPVSLFICLIEHIDTFFRPDERSCARLCGAWAATATFAAITWAFILLFCP